VSSNSAILETKSTSLDNVSLLSTSGRASNAILVHVLDCQPTSGTALISTSQIVPRYHLLAAPGLHLRNSCWYHASLHLLSTIPTLRIYLNTVDVKGSLAITFKDAMQAIVQRLSPVPVDNLFHLIKDFDGRNNRYGQIAVFSSIWRRSYRKYLLQFNLLLHPNCNVYGVNGFLIRYPRRYY